MDDVLLSLPGQPWLRRRGVASFFCENSAAKWTSYVSPSSSTGTLKLGTPLILSWYFCLYCWSVWLHWVDIYIADRSQAGILGLTNHRPAIEK